MPVYEFVCMKSFKHRTELLRKPRRSRRRRTSLLVYLLSRLPSTSTKMRRLGSASVSECSAVAQRSLLYPVFSISRSLTKFHSDDRPCSPSSIFTIAVYLINILVLSSLLSSSLICLQKVYVSIASVSCHSRRKNQAISLNTSTRNERLLVAFLGS